MPRPETKALNVDPPIHDSTAMLDGIPDDVVLHVFSLLDAADLATCSAVCRELRRLAASRDLWVRLLVADAREMCGWSICARQLGAVSRAAATAALSSHRRRAPPQPPQRRRASHELEAARAALALSSRPKPSPVSTAATVHSPSSADLCVPLLTVDSHVRALYEIDGPAVQFIGPKLGFDRAVRCDIALPTAPHEWLRAIAPAACLECSSRDSYREARDSGMLH